MRDGCDDGQGNEGGRRRSGGGDLSYSRRGVWRLLSDVIDDYLSTGKSWSNTSPNNDGGGGGGGGGEENCHINSSFQRWTAILPDITNSRGGVLQLAHCNRVGVVIGVGIGVGVCVGVDVGVDVGAGVGRAHPSDDWKDDDESGGRGGKKEAHLCLLGLLEIRIPT